MKIPFSKYSGCGNDFILIDNRENIFPQDLQALVTQLCERRKGVGADGVILLENSTTSDFKMRTFNTDGSEAEMCGNGIRCLIKFLQELNIHKKCYTIETYDRVHKAFCEGDNIKVETGPPTEAQWNLELTINSKTYPTHYLNTGVPHAVIFVPNIHNIDIMNLGPKIRHHPLFAPKGTNANVAAITPNSPILMRTYERGVEQETLACGTGAIATAIAAAKIHNCSPPIQIETRSKKLLEINFTMSPDISNITMTGPATFVYQGIFKAER